MNIRYEDDKKEKWQSHEAILDHSTELGNCDLHAYAYGASKEEAKEELLKHLTKLRDDLNILIERESK